jgi:hypothetical protein
MAWGFDALHIGDGDSYGGISDPYTDTNPLADMFRDYASTIG